VGKWIRRFCYSRERASRRDRDFISSPPKSNEMTIGIKATTTSHHHRTSPLSFSSPSIMSNHRSQFLKHVTLIPFRILDSRETGQEFGNDGIGRGSYSRRLRLDPGMCKPCVVKLGGGGDLVGWETCLRKAWWRLEPARGLDGQRELGWLQVLELERRYF
jgi:hypothetical protein